MAGAETSYAFFDTALGECALLWRDEMTVGLRLPHPNRRAALNQLKMEFGKPTESPMTREAKKVSGAVKRHLEGGKPDLAGIELDMTGVQPFSRSVYEFVRSIKAGETLTYGQVAEAIGNPGAARAVGQALGRNPFAIIVPCHRVVGSGGRIGGFSAAGGASTKMSLLEIEGAPLRKISDRPTGDFRRSYSATKAISHLKATDVRMGQLIESVGPYSMELRDTPSTFSSLTEAIVHQQLNGKAALAIHGRLCGLFPRSSDGPGPRQILRSSDEQLRSAGLSMSKIL
ncbi:MAG TPA: methylated-DNA--[protein]-cysteine S-methyltransferase, partial [Acidimicrobiales bacterium]|nr:methylated-DNA--[protein]-cysteine S-methyltransferase [Acidimicrobiales bacterium]